MMKKIELLAPAGNYQAFVGALHAGADAVYLGGEKFGARAYADNFTKEELCKALRYAHLYGKKIYLTLNTLVKEKEFSSLYEYAAPFYEAGLDGVILQDLGVWQYMRETFPDMELHASTQMTVTGTAGALFLKEIGASRIVPARELSLEELKEIKERTGLELECFIHGAMCYCYSGQCLFSSILGGRSGNRGRCAQPCRLPYQVSHGTSGKSAGECYPLSLKDMCTLEFLPKLIEIGIDSFKIEGRMKKPEYAAGVTAIYRKYIDRYYTDGAAHYHVEQPDMDTLRKLYIRSEIQTGYYERNNGREMITLQKPGYLGSDERLLTEIAQHYIQEEKKYPVTLKGTFHIGEPAMLQIIGSEITQTSYGMEVQQATGRPMDKESIAKQLRKTGNSHLNVTTEELDVEESVFMPVGQLNELRRRAVEAFEEKLIAAWGLPAHREPAEETFCTEDERTETMAKTAAEDAMPQMHVAVCTLEQLRAVCKYPCERIYLDSDFYMQEIRQICQILEESEKNAVFLALPYIVRKRDEMYLEDLSHLIYSGKYAVKTDIEIKGFLVRNLESFFWVKSLQKKYEIITDAGIYCFNSKTVRFLQTQCAESYLPYELNEKESRQVVRESGGSRLSMVIYTTIPMMITANCLRKTTGSCTFNCKGHMSYLTDRYQTKFPVFCNCRHCYNVIYNSLPYSLHSKQQAWQNAGLSAVRLDFTGESGRDTEDILDYYFKRKNAFPVLKYTAGHYKRGVE